MTNNHRVFNTSRNYWIKRKYALKGIKRDCNLAWVVENESVRDLDALEQVTARNEQARMREPLAYSELWGVSFEPPIGSEGTARESNLLIWAAVQFAAEETAKV